MINPAHHVNRRNRPGRNRRTGQHHCPRGHSPRLPKTNDAAFDPACSPKASSGARRLSGHQIEGNNTNADSWVLENVKPSIYSDPIGRCLTTAWNYGATISTWSNRSG